MKFLKDLWRSLNETEYHEGDVVIAAVIVLIIVTVLA
jgi:hypothetical protein